MIGSASVPIAFSFPLDTLSFPFWLALISVPGAIVKSLPAEILSVASKRYGTSSFHVKASVREPEV
jgi:hypothetical protein